MADVRDGLGPFLGIFLTEHHWQADNIGWVMSAGGLAGLFATIPAGLITDATHYKRLLLIAGSLIITLSTLLLWYFPDSWMTLFFADPHRTRRGFYRARADRYYAWPDRAGRIQSPDGA
ncbi:MFS transporter [Pantoea tagorei]